MLQNITQDQKKTKAAQWACKVEMKIIQYINQLKIEPLLIQYCVRAKFL